MGVKSRFVNKIHFPNYFMQDILEILRLYAKLSLKEGTYADEDLIPIAKYVSSTNPNARMTKTTLYNLAKMSKDILKSDSIKEAFEETEKTMWERDIETKFLHYKLVLLSIIKSWERYEKKKRYSRNSRYDYNFLPTTGNVFAIYEKVCNQFNENSKSMSTFKNVIKTLDIDGFINATAKSFGRARGLTTLLELSIPSESIKPIILKSLKKYNYNNFK